MEYLLENLKPKIRVTFGTKENNEKADNCRKQLDIAKKLPSYGSTSRVTECESLQTT
jgi:hypothetical protein